jgi:hypothetical protein
VPSPSHGNLHSTSGLYRCLHLRRHVSGHSRMKSSCNRGLSSSKQFLLCARLDCRCKSVRKRREFLVGTTHMSKWPDSGSNTNGRRYDDHCSLLFQVSVTTPTGNQRHIRTGSTDTYTRYDSDWGNVFTTFNVAKNTSYYFYVCQSSWITPVTTVTNLAENGGIVSSGTTVLVGPCSMESTAEYLFVKQQAESTSSASPLSKSTNNLPSSTASVPAASSTSSLEATSDHSGLSAAQ